MAWALMGVPTGRAFLLVRSCFEQKLCPDPPVVPMMAASTDIISLLGGIVVDLLFL
jgi:hypothetical protein